MLAKEIMTREPSCVTRDANVREVARMMKDEDVGLMPVVEDKGTRRLVGVVTDRDLAIRVVAEGRAGDSVSAGDVMSTGLKTCNPDDEVDKVMKLMGREQIRRVPIVDERGSLVGMVAQADVVLDADNEKKATRTVEKISKP